MTAFSEAWFIQITRDGTYADLVKAGFSFWDEYETVMLIPGKYYNIIPECFPIVTINGEEEKFKKGITDDDTRFGCLLYGIRTPKQTI